MTGAAMTIGCGILYMFSQTALSYKMADTLSLSRLRLIMAVVCSLTAASCILHVNHRDKICFYHPIDKTLLVLAKFWSMLAIILVGYRNVIHINLVIWTGFKKRKWENGGKQYMDMYILSHVSLTRFKFWSPLLPPNRCVPRQQTPFIGTHQIR